MSSPLMRPPQYYLSGLLTAAGCPYWVLVASLTVIAERVFNVFDATRAGLVVSLATATLGPLIEVRTPDLTTWYFFPHHERKSRTSMRVRTLLRSLCRLCL